MSPRWVRLFPAARLRKYRRGARLRHALLGDGTFRSRGSAGCGSPTYVIDFDRGGEKELIAAFCAGKLRKLP